MEDDRIIKNMREALKRTKKRNHRDKSKSKSNSSSGADDSIGEELGNQLMKNWVFRSPPSSNPATKSSETATSSEELSQQRVVKVNAFEKLMAKRHEPLTPISPETNQVKKKAKKSLKSKNSKANLDDEENTSMDNSSNSIRKFFHGSSTSLTEADAENNSNSSKKKRNRNTDKVELAKDEDEPVELINTAKRRKTKLESIELESNEIEVESPSTYQSGRPRRSCAGKVKYDEIVSPEKTDKSKKRPTKEIDVFEIDDESRSPIKPKKLAPVFVKKLPKPVIDPAVQEARRNFLFSDLPEDLRQTIDKQREFESEILSNELVAFPTVSHVMGNDTLIFAESVEWSKSRVKLSADDSSDDESSAPQEITLLFRGHLTDCRSRHERPKNVETAAAAAAPYHVDWDEESLKNLKNIVAERKKENGKFPTNRCFKHLFAKFQTLTAQQQSNSNDENFLFVDLVKPTALSEFVICRKPTEQLHSFLQTWNEKSYEENLSDDSYCSDSQQSSRSMNNFAVLTGSCGSGKTLAVYAMANELNFRVIEVNAGSRRSGKIMLQELQEATQSHRVKKVENTQQEQSSNDEQKSVILIEDAELVFESDDGFVSAIQQLINISKRPVILTTNNFSCQHLQKFINHNEIAFDMSADDNNSSNESNHIGKYLSLLCLAANYQIDSIDIQHLFMANERDMRKTINEIEFFIRSQRSSSNDDDLLGFYRCRRRPLATRAENRQQSTDISSMHFELSMMSSWMLSSAAGKEDDLMADMKCFIVNRCCNVMDTERQSKEGMHKIIPKRSSSSSWTASTIASHLISTQSTTNRVLSTDYSPFLRDMCRSEKARLDGGRRTSSNNRGHYLRFLIAQNSFGNDYFNEQTELFRT